MAKSMRCKVAGCDLDACGVCRRCGDESKASHSYKDADRERPCFKRQVCERCGVAKETPEHDWETAGEGPTAALTCTRCGIRI